MTASTLRSTVYSTLRSVPARLSVRGRRWIEISPALWQSKRGHQYALFFQGDKVNGWSIAAGCRMWRSFADAKKHYGPEWRTHEGFTTYEPERHGPYQTRPIFEWSDKTRESHRKDALRIVGMIERFAKKHGIKLLGEVAVAKKKWAAKKRKVKPRGVSSKRKKTGVSRVRKTKRARKSRR